MMVSCLQDIDSSATSIIDVFRDNFWGERMGDVNSRHQVPCFSTIISINLRFVMLMGDHNAEPH